MAKTKVNKPRVTAKSIITNGIKSGWTMARILSTVEKKLGKSTTEQVVRIYASTMCKNKEITVDQKNKYLIRKAGEVKAAKPKAVVKKKAAPKKKVAKKKAVKKK